MHSLLIICRNKPFMFTSIPNKTVFKYSSVRITGSPNHYLTPCSFVKFLLIRSAHFRRWSAVRGLALVIYCPRFRAYQISAIPFGNPSAVYTRGKTIFKFSFFHLIKKNTKTESVPGLHRKSRITCFLTIVCACLWGPYAEKKSSLFLRF